MRLFLRLDNCSCFALDRCSRRDSNFRHSWLLTSCILAVVEKIKNPVHFGYFHPWISPQANRIFPPRWFSNSYLSPGAITATGTANNHLFIVSKNCQKNPYLKKQAPGKPFFGRFFLSEKSIVFSKKHYILCLQIKKHLYIDIKPESPCS